MSRLRHSVTGNNNAQEWCDLLYKPGGDGEMLRSFSPDPGPWCHRCGGPVMFFEATRGNLNAKASRYTTVLGNKCKVPAFKAGYTTSGGVITLVEVRAVNGPGRSALGGLSKKTMSDMEFKTWIEDYFRTKHNC